MDPIVLIIVGVIALVVVIALIAVAARAGNRKKVTEAAELRHDARHREQELQRQHLVAREQEHRAGAAEEEAKAKVAESERLRTEAEQQRSTLDDQQRDVRRMEQTADKLDPRHRGDDLNRERGVTAPGGGLDGGLDRDRGTAGPGNGLDRDRGAPGDDRGVTGTGGGLTGAATPRDSGSEFVDPDPVDGPVDRPGDGPVGRHAAGADPADPAAPRDREPRLTDKLLGRDHPDEPRR